jgi:hypothetical protein
MGLVTGTPRRRRWKPGWLTPRVAAVGSAFTLVILAVVLSVASVSARPAAAEAQGKPPGPAVHAPTSTPAPARDQQRNHDSGEQSDD